MHKFYWLPSYCYFYTRSHRSSPKQGKTLALRTDLNNLEWKYYILKRGVQGIAADWDGFYASYIILQGTGFSGLTCVEWDWGLSSAWLIHPHSAEVHLKEALRSKGWTESGNSVSFAQPRTQRMLDGFSVQSRKYQAKSTDTTRRWFFYPRMNRNIAPACAIRPTLT